MVVLSADAGSIFGLAFLGSCYREARRRRLVMVGGNIITIGNSQSMTAFHKSICYYTAGNIISRSRETGLGHKAKWWW